MPILVLDKNQLTITNWMVCSSPKEWYLG